MARQISSFLFIVICFLFCSKDGAGREGVPGFIVQKVQQVAAGTRDAHQELTVPAHEVLKGRPGTGHTVSLVSEKAPAPALWQPGTGSFIFCPYSIYCPQAFCSAADALAVFLQGLLYPKHSFW